MILIIVLTEEDAEVLNARIGQGGIVERLGPLLFLGLFDNQSIENISVQLHAYGVQGPIGVSKLQPISYSVN